MDGSSGEQLAIREAELRRQSVPTREHGNEIFPHYNCGLFPFTNSKPLTCMIVDPLDGSLPWISQHPYFAQAISFLRNALRQSATPGKYILIPDRLWVIVEQVSGRAEWGAILEAHRRFIDIQLVLQGHERIGWRPLADCRHVTAAYDVDRDIEFFGDRPATWIDLAPGQLAVFFPSDAHAPLGGTGEVLKAIAKVAVEENQIRNPNIETRNKFE